MWYKFIYKRIFLGENYVNYLGKGLSSYYSYVCVLSLIYFFVIITVVNTGAIIFITGKQNSILQIKPFLILFTK